MGLYGALVPVTLHGGGVGSMIGSRSAEEDPIAFSLSQAS